MVTVTSRLPSLQGVVQMIVQETETWLLTLGAAQAAFPSPVTVTLILFGARPVAPMLVPATVMMPPKMDGRVVMDVTVGAA